MAMAPKKLILTDALRAEYHGLFRTCVVRPEHQAEIDATARAMVVNEARYRVVSNTTGVPWTVIAANHELECGLSFSKHLHNGDPLSAKTVNDPKGRPLGNPPWMCEQSAVDALKVYARWTDWSLAGALFMMELYNGSGYRLYHPAVLSPYPWSYSNHYTMGKYKSDGVWSPTLVSRQPGAAVLLRRMAELRANGFSDQPPPASIATPLAVPYAVAQPTDPAMLASGAVLQRWLNTHSGIFVKPDGWAGDRTSDAYKLVTGHPFGAILAEIKGLTPPRSSTGCGWWSSARSRWRGSRP